MKRLVITLLALAIGMCSLTGVIPVTAAEKTYKIRLSLYWPPSHHLVETANYFAETVKQTTNGRLVVEVYPSGQLYSQKESLKAVALGNIEMSDEFMGKAGVIDPLFGVVQTNMFLLTNYEMIWRYMDHPVFREIIEELYADKLGVKPLFYVASGSMIIITNSKRPLKKPSDLSDLLIRVPSKALMEKINAWGGKGVIMSSGEQIMAMQRGTVDGALTSVGDGVSRHIWEVQKYALAFQNPITHPFIINLKYLNGLPTDLRGHLESAAQKAQGYGRDLLTKVEGKKLETLKSKMNVYVLPATEAEAWAQVIEPLSDKWVKDNGENAGRLRDLMVKVRTEVLSQ
jgi:C4-dicarboxylate-binding protein DctP